MNGSTYSVVAPRARMNGTRAVVASLLVSAALVASFAFGRMTAPSQSIDRPDAVGSLLIPGNEGYSHVAPRLAGGSHVAPRLAGGSHVTPGIHEVAHEGIRLHHGVVREG